MQHGSLTTKSRLEGPDVWQFRWSEKGPHGTRVYRKRVIGTVEEYPDNEATRHVVSGLITEVNWVNLQASSIAMTVAQLCSHFEQRELAKKGKRRETGSKKQGRGSSS
jgi:integrase